MLPKIEHLMPTDRSGGAFARAVSIFKDCLTDAETLRTIDNLFIDLGFDFNSDVEERENERAVGQRRARAAGYLETLHPNIADDRRRMIEAMSTKVAEWGDDPKWEHLTRLHRVMKTAGYEWNGTEFVPSDEPTRATAQAPTKSTATAAAAASRDEGVVGPAVFISYAHEDEAVAHALAASLRARGCRVWIDSEGMRVGDKLVSRIATAIDEVDFLIALLSPASVESQWCQRELSLAATGELARKRVTVLPVRLGEVPLPLTLKDTFSPRVDPADIEGMADRLVADMASHRGDSGAFRSERTPAPRTPIDIPEAPAEPPRAGPDEPIKILGIDVDKVGRPRNDGTRGSALYEVPLRLNRRPSALWAEILQLVWDHPPRFTTMHRPGIARVSGDRVILDGTTIEEIEQYHAETLRLVVPEVNRRVLEIEAAEEEKRRRAEEERRSHDASVRDKARNISFD